MTILTGERTATVTIFLKTSFLFLAILIALPVEWSCHGDGTAVLDDESLRQEFLRYSLENAGDAERGKALFNHPEKALCSKCHLLTGMEKSGPNLDGVADKYPFEQLARQILYPSEFIAHGFELVKILTADGTAFSGRMERSNQMEVKLVDGQGKINTIKRKNIEEMKEVAASFMPADIQNTLTRAEFADLMAYLKTLKYALQDGYVYRGSRSPSYDGVYIFGDYNTRLIWGLRQQDGKLVDVCRIGAAPNGIASFGTDQRGEIYVVTYKGTIYHMDLSQSEYPNAS